jgi:tetratricopeptide (TPR) repeat protein
MRFGQNEYLELVGSFVLPGETGRAEEVARQLARKKSWLPRAYGKIAQVQMLRGDIDGALATMERLGDGGKLTQRAAALSAIYGNPGEAMEIIHRYGAAWPRHGRTVELARTAYAFAAAGREEEAKKIIGEAEALLDGEEATGYLRVGVVLLGRAWGQLGDLDSAADLIRRYLKPDPAESELSPGDEALVPYFGSVRAEYAARLSRNGDSEAGRAAFAEAVALLTQEQTRELINSPALPLIYREADVYWQSGDAAGCLEVLRSVTDPQVRANALLEIANNIHRRSARASAADRGGLDVRVANSRHR